MTTLYRDTSSTVSALETAKSIGNNTAEPPSLVAQKFNILMHALAGIKNPKTHIATAANEKISVSREIKHNVSTS